MGKHCKWPGQWLLRLWRDRRGVSAVEFALLAPVMIVILFGSVETSLLLTADRKVTQTASSVADLVAQDDIITVDEMTDIFTASTAILEPYDTAPLQMRVSSVSMAADNSISVDWSEGKNMTPRAPGSSVSMPSGLLQPNTSIVMAEVSYAYVSSIGAFLKTPITLNDTFYLRPRRALKVTGP